MSEPKITIYSTHYKSISRGLFSTILHADDSMKKKTFNGFIGLVLEGKDIV
jgi:hypothetical protein